MTANYKSVKIDSSLRANEEKDFWFNYQPGFRFTDQELGTAEFFAEVERHRYSLEPHIKEVVRFDSFCDKDVLEAGCGIGTDGIQFARAGANYTAIDSSQRAVDLAQKRFAQENMRASIVQGSATDLPYKDESFDFVYSHGVIHHIESTEAAVEEFHRVLRPGGKALVMLYHRTSLNYYFNIMILRRALIGLLLAPGAVPLVSRLTGEDKEVLEGHLTLLQKNGLNYITDTALFLSNNTDGPGNSLSKVYTRHQAQELFRCFDQVTTEVQYLNLRIYPGGQRLAKTTLARFLEKRFGWHLYIEAQKTSL